MQQLNSKIDESAAFIRGRWDRQPRVGVILGSGLGAVADAIEVEVAIGYDEIPHFLKSTAVGHHGRLLCGTLAGVPLVAMQGRFHCYEGYAADRVTFPVRVMKQLGIELLVVSNAAGGLNPTFTAGNVMVIDDHVNLLNGNPLRGDRDDRLRQRFPHMSAPYDRRLNDQTLAIARQQGFVCHRGTYVAVLGPNYETRAEIRMLRRIGDAVGMSTVPEVIVAAHAGLKVLGLSTITNVCSPDLAHTANGDEVVAMAHSASAQLCSIVTEIVAHQFG